MTEKDRDTETHSKTDPQAGQIRDANDYLETWPLQSLVTRAKASSLMRPQGFPSGAAADAAAESLQSCPDPCDPMDSSPPGSSVHRIL